MKKILLVNPSFKGSLHSNIKVLAIPPLNLATLASQTPERFDVSIIDEAVEDIDFNQHYDLVGITCMTPLAPRAYELCGEFKKRGIPVVIGGVHVSYMSEEAARYADCVVIGEADHIWAKVLEDFENGKMQKFYTVADRPDITHLPVPRRDLFNGDYFVETIQTSRGCPFKCSFCSVTAFNGAKYRLRDIDNVIDEVNSLKSKRIFFTDDNIVGSGKRCIERSYELFDRMKDTGKEWGGQACINIVEHDNLLQAAQRGGCKALLIGFESIDPETIASDMNKSVNLRAKTKNFKDAIKKIHDHGIAMVGCFIFGSDTQNKDIFKRTVDFVLENEIDAVQFTIETPLPGTARYKQIVSEDRLLLTDYPHDWQHYTIFQPVFKPKNMTPEELHEGLIGAYKEVSSFGTSLTRGIRTFMNTRSLFSTGLSFSWNYDAYKTITNTVPGMWANQ